MDINMIDMPEYLRPIAFLPDIEIELSSTSKEVVDLCRESDCDDPKFVAEMARKAERLWVERGDPLGHAVAFLWLANLSWRHRAPKETLSYCQRAVEHMPNGQAPTHATLYSIDHYRIGRPSLLPISMTTKSAAHYFLGMSRQVLDRMSEAFDSYQQTSELFEATQAYWRRVGSKGQVDLCNEILGWIEKLKVYARLRFNPRDQPTSARTLTYPLRSNVQKCIYLLLELESRRIINASVIGGAVQKFLLDDKRAQPWYCDKGEQTDGYVVGTKLRVLDSNNALRPATLIALNPNARLGDNILLPAGADYTAYLVSDQLSLPDPDIRSGDYVLVCNVSLLDPAVLALCQHKRYKDTLMFGVFERDAAGTVHLQTVLVPPRFVGENQTNIGLLGNVDYILRPA